MESAEKPSDVYSWVMAELNECGTSLMLDQFGNYVTQAIFKKGAPKDRANVLRMVGENLMDFSRQKYASNVVENCYRWATEEEKRSIMTRVLQPTHGESNLLVMIKDQYANYVVQTLLDCSKGAMFDTIANAVRPEFEKAKRSGCTGKQISSIEKFLLPKQESQSYTPYGYANHTESTSAGASVTPPPAHAASRHGAEG